MSYHDRLYNEIDDPAWLRDTALRGYEAPAFQSFTISGNEDCPLAIRLYAKREPRYDDPPIVEYRLETEAHSNLGRYVELETPSAPRIPPGAKLRRVHLRPYRRGMGPRFTLETWATNRTDSRGQTYLGYVLRQHGDDTTGRGRLTRVIFAGSDFAGSPMHADDSDRTLGALLGFLTLRLGDTDREYFDRYTAVQERFRDTHAETLSAEVHARFPED